MNYRRVKRIISESINRLKLNLEGYTVYTEVGTNLFAATPVIAVLAGASKVYVVGKDTSYGSKEEAILHMKLILDDQTLYEKIVISDRENSTHLFDSDIITNLGNVRPIDNQFIEKLNNQRAVIPYMCEAWEFRPDDIDINSCKINNIPVLATNEEFELIDCFESCGNLVAKLLYEANLEIRHNKIAIYSSDKFGEVISNSLEKMGANVTVFHDASELNNTTEKNFDALILSEYTSVEELISKKGKLELQRLVLNNPDIYIIPFAGYFELNYAKNYTNNIYPEVDLEPYRMSKTLAYLGPKPTIDLIIGGLKIGQLMRNYKQNTLNVDEIIFNIKNSEWSNLIQEIEVD